MKITKFILICFICVFSLNMNAQQKVSSARSKQMISIIIRQTNKLKTVSSSFKQTSKLFYLDKPAISYGTMEYNKNGNLIWKYTKPFSYTFRIQDGKAYMTSGKRTETVDLKASHNYQKIVSMVQNSFTGNALRNNKNFNVVMYVKDHFWIAHLYPKTIQMKKYLKKAVLTYDSSHHIFSNIEALQPNGDSVTLQFYDYKGM